MGIKVQKVVVGLLKTNCYIVTNSDHDVTIIDPGDEADKIISFLKKKNLNKVKNILLTHTHSDHVRALDEIVGQYPQAQVYLSKKEIDFERTYKNKNALFVMIFPGFKSDYVTVTERESISFGSDHFKIIETPGHTPGSLCYLIDGKLFSGDTLFYRSFGITDFPGGDDLKMKESLTKLSQLPNEVAVFPGHLLETTIQQEKEFGFLS